MQETDPVLKQIVLEQRKEISRLQKLLAKTEVKKDSEIAKLKAQLAEARKGIPRTPTKIVLVPLEKEVESVTQ